MRFLSHMTGTALPMNGKVEVEYCQRWRQKNNVKPGRFRHSALRVQPVELKPNLDECARHLDTFDRSPPLLARDMRLTAVPYVWTDWIGLVYLCTSCSAAYIHLSRSHCCRCRRRCHRSCSAVVTVAPSMCQDAR